MTKDTIYKSYTDYVNLSYAMFLEDNTYPFENVLTFEEYCELLIRIEQNSDEVFELIGQFVEDSGKDFVEEMTKAINLGIREGILPS